MARPSLLASAALAWAALAIFSIGGCSLAFDLDREQCETNEDCAALGLTDATCSADKVCVAGGTGGNGQGGEGTGGAGGDPPLPENFACIEGYQAPDPGDMIAHEYRFEKATNGDPPTNASLKVCQSLDAACATPELTLVPDVDGIVQFDLASDFQGFMEFTADDAMGTLVFFQRPVVIPPSQKVIRFVDQPTFLALASSAGVTVDLARGVTILLSHDCADERAAGVRFTTSEGDDQMIPFHFIGSFPDPDATETDAQGAGGFVNIPLGNLTVQATIAETGRIIGESTFFVRAAHISYVPMGPTEL